MKPFCYSSLISAQRRWSLAFAALIDNDRYLLNIIGRGANGFSFRPLESKSEDNRRIWMTRMPLTQMRIRKPTIAKGANQQNPKHNLSTAPSFRFATQTIEFRLARFSSSISLSRTPLNKTRINCWWPDGDLTEMYTFEPPGHLQWSGIECSIHFLLSFLETFHGIWTEKIPEIHIEANWRSEIDIRTFIFMGTAKIINAKAAEE